ncbi:MAG: hypothetical protein Q8880_03000 [Bacteroidota bacterium]|nr:hypothetical protein [Bacteroidota bacterium]
MALENLISFNLTAAEITQIETALQTIKTVIQGKVINLTTEERQEYGKVGNERANFIVKALGYMLQRPDLVPNYINLTEFQNDVAARQSIVPLLNQATEIHEMFSDTNLLLGTDVYNTAIAFYRNVKIAAQQNVPGSTNIYQDLQVDFPGRPKKIKTTNP